MRVVSENARAYPGRPRLATTRPRYSPKSSGRRPAYSLGRYDFQVSAAHGGAMAARRRIRRAVLTLAAVGGFFIPIIFGHLVPHTSFDTDWVFLAVVSFAFALLGLTGRNPAAVSEFPGRPLVRTTYPTNTF